MKKDELIKYLKDNNILNKKNGRKFCWKKNWTNEINKIWLSYANNYRSEEEAWFCLIHNVEPYKCEICCKLAKFSGSKNKEHLGYNTTCENCSPNNSKKKKQKFSNTIKNRSKEENKKIFEKRRQTLKEKYGDENYTLFGSNSFKEKLKEKYGDENYHNIEKYKQTMLEKYGVDHNFKLLNSSEKSKKYWEEHYDDNINKIKQTCKNKYNSDNFFSSEKFKEKTKQTLISIYGSVSNAYKKRYEKNKQTKINLYNDENFNNSVKTKNTLKQRQEIFENNNNCTKFNTLIELYGQGWKSLNLNIIYDGRYRYISNDDIPKIQKYISVNHNVQTVSKGEIELRDFIKSLTPFNVLNNVKNIIYDNTNNFELDIFIPELKLAFEYNGNYWHSLEFKNKYYHQYKTKLCYSFGIQLIHIYEFDWIKNNEQIKHQLYELLNGKNCSDYNWISVSEYNNYKLSAPQKIIINENINKYKKSNIIYNEGKFIKI